MSKTTTERVNTILTVIYELLLQKTNQKSRESYTLFLMRQGFQIQNIYTFRILDLLRCISSFSDIFRLHAVNSIYFALLTNVAIQINNGK